MRSIVDIRKSRCNKDVSLSVNWKNRFSFVASDYFLSIEFSLVFRVDCIRLSCIHLEEKRLKS